MEEIKRGSKAGFVLGLIAGILGIVFSVLFIVFGIIVLLIFNQFSQFVNQDAGGLGIAENILSMFKTTGASFDIIIGSILLLVSIFVVFASNWARDAEKCRRGSKCFLFAGIAIFLYSLLGIFLLESILGIDSLLFILPGILLIIAGISGLKASR